MDGPPKKQRRKVDPATRKKRDNARQRKIVANSSDKSFRKGAPLIKAMANRKVRRTAKPDPKAEPDMFDLGDVRSALRTRDRHWGTENASSRRAGRDEERAWLQSHPPTGRPGRSRWTAEVTRRARGWSSDDPRFLRFLHEWRLHHPSAEWVEE